MAVAVKQPAITLSLTVSTSITTVEIIFLDKKHQKKVCSLDKEIKIDFTNQKELTVTQSTNTEQYALSCWIGYLHKEPYSEKQKLFSSLVFNNNGMVLVSYKATKREIIDQIKKILSTRFEIPVEQIEVKEC